MLNNSYTEVCNCIACVCIISSAKDPTAWKLFDSCLELLKSRMESRELDKEVSANVSYLRGRIVNVMTIAVPFYENNK